MIVKVCDAICGAGKTQSCISMMNEQTDTKFIFVTPYLSEVERIKTNCASREFTSPETGSSSSKLKSLNDLLREGRNIASTHALFTYYTDETKQLIKDGKYTLVLDEVINLFQPVELNNQDIDILIKSQALTSKEGEFVWEDSEYCSNGAFSDIMLKSKSNNLIKYKDEMYFWSIPPDIFQSFDSIYVLTYMFEYQMQKYFFDIYNIQYELIGTRKVDGNFEFCKLEEMDRRKELRDKIHILDSPKLNEVGDDLGALSFSWYGRASAEKEKPKLVRLKKNLGNVFRNIFKCRSKDYAWSTFKDYREVLEGKGHTNNFITYNKRATNDYADRKYLSYLINVYMQTWAKNYLIENGAQNVSENMYAISTLIQWLFRSAIRRGEEVWLYLPSKRMRTLFTKWLDNLADGRDLEAIQYFNTKQETITLKTKSNDLKTKLQQIRLNKGVKK